MPAPWLPRFMTNNKLFKKKLYLKCLDLDCFITRIHEWRMVDLCLRGRRLFY